MIRIAFGCTRRVGKDTCCEILADHYTDAQRLSFAGPLYSIMNFIQDTCHREPVKDRYLLQSVGGMLRDHYGADIWCKMLMDKVKQIENENPDSNILISDVRFENEANFLREAGFTLIKVERNVPRDESVDSDVSERGIDDSFFDFVIENNGTVEELKEKLMIICASL